MPHAPKPNPNDKPSEFLLEAMAMETSRDITRDIVSFQEEIAGMSSPTSGMLYWTNSVVNYYMVQGVNLEKSNVERELYVDLVNFRVVKSRGVRSPVPYDTVVQTVPHRWLTITNVNKYLRDNTWVSVDNLDRDDTKCKKMPNPEWKQNQRAFSSKVKTQFSRGRR